MNDIPCPVPEPLPIVVSAHADQTSAVARLVLVAITVLGLLAAVALPAHALLVGMAERWSHGECVAVAVGGGVVALFTGLLWVAALPVCWTVEAGGITQEGPWDRRRDIRWADVRWIWRDHHGYKFYGRSGLTPLCLPWDAIPKDRRAAVRAGVDVVLRKHFRFPPPPPYGLGRLLARIVVLIAAVYGPPGAYFWHLNHLVSTSPQTILGWAWVRSLLAWNLDAARVLLCVVLLGPGLAYLALVPWLVGRKAIREGQIVPK